MAEKMNVAVLNEIGISFIYHRPQHKLFNAASIKYWTVKHHLRNDELQHAHFALKKIVA